MQRHLAQIKCRNPVEDLPWASFPHFPLLQVLPPLPHQLLLPLLLLLLVVLAVLLPADLPVLAVFLLQAVFPVLPPLL